MRTARALTVSPSMLCAGGCMVPGGCAWSGGCAWYGGCMVRGMHGPEGCMVQGDGQGWGCARSRGGVPGPGVVSQHALRHIPPVNRMTNRCKNITLPQTSFASGNNVFYGRCNYPTFTK